MRDLTFEQRIRFKNEICDVRYLDEAEALLERIERAVRASVIAKQQQVRVVVHNEQPSGGLPFYDTTPDENWGYGTT